MAGRVQTAGRSHLGGVPSCRSTHRARSAPAPASSRQTKGGASRSQDARTAGLEHAQRRRHLHTVHSNVSCLGRYIHPHMLCICSACTALRVLHLGTAHWIPPTCRALALVKPQQQASKQQASNSDGLPGLHFPRFPSKVSPCSDHHLAVSSLAPSSRQPGDDGSNCQVKVGIPHETNRTLIFECLSQCYLSPFLHAWPAHRSCLLSSKVSASSTISGSPLPLHCGGLLHLSHQVHYTMPSRPQKSPFISTIHSLHT